MHAFQKSERNSGIARIQQKQLRGTVTDLVNVDQERLAEGLLAMQRHLEACSEVAADRT
jgi:hypothetical protein